VNAGASMTRHEAAIGVQFWQQGERKMTAVNGVLEGMANTRESAILSAAVEAVEWRHCLEPEDGPRSCQLVIVYPSKLPQLGEVLSTQDPNLDPEDGHPIAYSKILEGCKQYENPPRFYREDCDEIKSDPTLSASVPLWMNTTAQVSTGGRQLVLENGADVLNPSNEDSENEDHGYEGPNTCTKGMDPKKGPLKLTQTQVAVQKAAAAMQKEMSEAALLVKDLPRSQSPGPGSSDDDDPNGPDMFWSPSKGCMPPNKNKKRSSAPQVHATCSTEILKGPTTQAKFTTFDQPAVDAGP
jgi:hypothetical protein